MAKKQEKQTEIEELKVKLFKRCKEFEKAEFETLKLEKYKTPILWDIGDVAILLKEALGHGNWEPLVQQCVTESRIGSKRTMERAMKIRKNFENRDDCAGLAVTEAEKFSDELETIEKDKDRCQSTIARKKQEKKNEARRKKEENERLEKKLAKKFDPKQQAKEEEGTPQVKPGPQDEAEDDTDEAVLSEMVESLCETLCDEPSMTLTAEEEAAFETFAGASGIVGIKQRVGKW